MSGMPSARTRVAAVIGDPIRHSLSPAIHNAAFAACGLDWVYVAFEVAAGSGADAVRAMRTLGIDGLSVTMPHKQAVAEACDECSADAAALSSVNCVVRRSDGSTWGDSTDGAGFVRAMHEAGHDPSGLRVVLLGAGGAARAVALALVRGGAQVTVCARRADAAERAAAVTGARAGAWDDRADATSAADLLVNATPVGMGADRSLPIPPDALRSGLVVADLITHPLDTALLLAARQAGAPTVDGLGMLVHQAAIAFEHWTGTDAPVAAMHAAARAALTG